MLLAGVFAGAALAVGLIYYLSVGLIWQSLAVAVSVYVGLHVLLVLFYAVVGLFINCSRPLDKQNRLCRFGSWAIGSLGCFYMGVRPHLVGGEKLPRDSRFVMVANHRSAQDPISVLCAMWDYNISFVSKPSNMKLPVLGRVAYGAGFLPLDRDNDRNALRSILQAADYLKRDICSIAIYPEGTRNRGRGLLPFHAGSFKLPQRAGVPLVIMAATGTSSTARHGLFGHDVYLNILEVMDARQVKAMTTAELSDYARDKISGFLMSEENK